MSQTPQTSAESSDIPVQPTPAVTEPAVAEPAVTELDPQPKAVEPKPSYVKLAMRNMVRKRGKSLYHFTLTTVGLLTLLIGLSYLTR